MGGGTAAGSASVPLPRSGPLPAHHCICQAQSLRASVHLHTRPFATRQLKSERR